MRSSIRIGLGSAVFVATAMVIGSSAFAPSEPDSSRSSIQDPIAGKFVSPEQLREYHALTARQQASLWRSARKQEIAAELVRGEITLKDAAARFREIMQSDPHALDGLRTMFPTATDDERYHRNVIAFVRSLVRIDPVRVRTLIVKLNAEVQARFPAILGTGVPAG